MSYTKTVWRDGDVISAAKMNKIENGIENSLSDKLQALYKTMVGEDWPYGSNPTNAEVIDKIAQDATAGGGGTRVIKLSELEDITSSIIDLPEGAVAYQYEPNLTIGDFRGGIVVVEHTTSQENNLLTECLIYAASTIEDLDVINFTTSEGGEGDTLHIYSYMPEEHDSYPAGMLVDLTEVFTAIIPEEPIVVEEPIT